MISYSGHILDFGSGAIYTFALSVNKANRFQNCRKGERPLVLIDWCWYPRNSAHLISLADITSLFTDSFWGLGEKKRNADVSPLGLELYTDLSHLSQWIRAAFKIPPWKISFHFHPSISSHNGSWESSMGINAQASCPAVVNRCGRMVSSPSFPTPIFQKNLINARVSGVTRATW